MNAEPRKLVIYYSLEGNTGCIAKAIAEEAGADIMELKMKDGLDPNGSSKFFKGGMQAVFNMNPELVPFEKNPVDYDLLFIGMPTWAGRPASPFNTLIKVVNLKGKKVALFNCNKGGIRKTFEVMKKRLTGCEFLGEMSFLDPLANDSDNNKIKAKHWTKEILSK